MLDALIVLDHAVREGREEQSALLGLTRPREQIAEGCAQQLAESFEHVLQAFRSQGRVVDPVNEVVVVRETGGVCHGRIVARPWQASQGSADGWHARFTVQPTGREVTRSVPAPAHRQ